MYNILDKINNKNYIMRKESVYFVVL